MNAILFVITFLSMEQTQGSPFDDGKYHPKVYSYDSGRYNRPSEEGMYIPGDEGIYTYVYKQGLYPDDDGNYMYIHQVGPNGPEDDPNSRDAPNGDDPGGPNGPGGPGEDSGKGPTWNNYIGRKIYAGRHPYVEEILDEVVDYFINKSRNYVFYGDDTGASVPNYHTIKIGETAVKCQCIEPEADEVDIDPVKDAPSSSHRPADVLKEGMYYKFQGKSSYRDESDSSGSKKALFYEVTIRIVNEALS